MKRLHEPLTELHDRFSQNVMYGEVIGSRGDGGALRLGIDAEAKISVDDGVLRFAPLDRPGWGRQGIAYGPFERRPGLALGVWLLNGHNNSQTYGDARSPRRLFGSREEDAAARSPFKAHFEGPPLRENLAVGWFEGPAPASPLESGQSLVMRGHPTQNGALCAAKVRGLHHLLAGLQNNPLLLVTVLREHGAAFYAASLEGSRHLPGPPRLRPLAIDPYGLAAEQLYAGVHQSILGEMGHRADTRVYGVRVARVPAWEPWHGGALIADRQPQLGRAAARGRVWALQSPCMLLRPAEPGGLFHVRLSAPASLVWRYRDPGHYLALELSPQEARLRLQFGGQAYTLASAPAPLAAQQPCWVQVLDDGDLVTVTLDGRPLFADGPLREPRLAAEAGVGLIGGAADLEVHPREVALPEALELGRPWQPRGQQVVYAPYLSLAPDDMLLSWEPTLGRGALTPAEGGLRVEGAGAARSLHTTPWDSAELADLEVEILPPGRGAGEGQQSRAGVCFWQDAKHHLVVTLRLDDAERSVAAVLRFAGYEDPYDMVWSQLPDALYHGVPVRLRVVCDGRQFQAYLDGEPVLYRALADIYPGADRLEVRRVGLALGGYGEDTGSVFRSWTARK